MFMGSEADDGWVYTDPGATKEKFKATTKTTCICCASRRSYKKESKLHLLKALPCFRMPQQNEPTYRYMPKSKGPYNQQRPQKGGQGWLT